MLHQFPRLSQHLGCEGSWHFTVLWLWGKSGPSSSRQGLAAGQSTDSHPLSYIWHICRVGTGSSLCCTGMCLPAPGLSLPHIPWLCKALATEARDERKRMQTSEEGERLWYKENTANSVVIIQTPGFALSSSFTQEAQPRTAGERRRCFPALGVSASPALATSCTWSMALMP